MTAGKLIAWTSSQRAAIDHRDGNLVVSASAGAGKTAVLTERVLSLLTDASNGTPPRLDEMLIITFTEKAARQMRERIEERLREALRAEPDSRLLRQALDGISNSWIMTIDAFCRRVVLEHFHRADLPPMPRVPDSSELAELEMDAIDSVAEAWAAGAEEKRGALTDLTIALGGDQRRLAETVRMLIHFLDSLDHPQRWRENVKARIDRTLAAKDYAELPEARAAAEACGRGARELAEAWSGVIDAACAVCKSANLLECWKGMAARLGSLVAPDGPLACDAIQTELTEDFDGLLDKITNKGVCGKELFDSELKRSHLEPLKKAYIRWRDRWFGLDEAGLYRGAQLAATQAKCLFEMIDEAATLIGSQKLRRGLVTFNDFERHTLNILSDESGDGPSEIAAQYRARFKTVLVDEYQDTSPLQDAIVRRVAQEDDPGNLFLVGDYKQSIYRFRHADPLLLRAKLELAETGVFRRIDLAENFRSQPELIDFVNSCFEQLMDREVGEVDYGARERLVAGRAAEPEGDPVRVEVAWLPSSFERTASDTPAEEPAEESEQELLEGVEAQAAWVARRIRAMVAEGGRQPGDFAILLRTIRADLERWVLALNAEGLKVRAPGINPLFTTQELLDLRAALSVADNPLQDLWLATLMRSPMGGFSDDDLLRIRLVKPHGHFHESFFAAARESMDGLPESLASRLGRFVKMIDRWRECALRDGALDVLERILRDTHYEAWLAGRPEAAARLENVEHLRRMIGRFDAAEDGANALSRFLELLDRAADLEQVEDLPETVGDTTDCVNLLTVHKSKGLEFPVVILPRLERGLRHGSSYGPVQFDREAGIGLTGVDPETRRQYRTLEWQRLRDVMERKDRSEELRLLYVAMTRARERLILVTQRDAASIDDPHAGLGALARLNAYSLADLVAPIIALNRQQNWIYVHETDQPIVAASEIERPLLKRALSRTGENPQDDWRAAIAQLRDESGGIEEPTVAIELMPRIDPAAGLGTLPAKTTVTALRRVHDETDYEREENLFVELEMIRPSFTRESALGARQPAWTSAGEDKVDGSERGSWTHALLANVALEPSLNEDRLREAMRDLIDRGVIETGSHSIEAVLDSIDYEALCWFFETELGRRMCERPGAVNRELPFSARRPIYDLDPKAGTTHPTESFLLQGVIDAVIDDGDGAILIDYKTDFIKNEQALAERVEHHRLQIELYGKCLKSIWGLKSVKSALVFLRAKKVIWVQ